MSGPRSSPRGPEALHELGELLLRLPSDAGRWLGAHRDRVRLDVQRGFRAFAIELVVLACLGALVVRGAILVVDGVVELLSAPGGWLSLALAKLLVGAALGGLVVGTWFIVSRRVERRAADCRRRQEQAAGDIGDAVRGVGSAAMRSLDVSSWAQAHPLGAAATAAALGGLAGSRLASTAQRRRPVDGTEHASVDDGSEPQLEPRATAGSSTLLAAFLPFALHALGEWLPRPPASSNGRVDGPGAGAGG